MLQIEIFSGKIVIKGLSGTISPARLAGFRPGGFADPKKGVVVQMETQNICKFISDRNEGRIYTTRFVFEKSEECRTSSSLPANNVMYLVVSGKGRVCTEAVTREISAGNVFFTFAQLPYKIESTENLRYLYISFNGSRSEELFSRFGISPIHCVFDGHEGIASFWKNAIAKAGEKNLDLISESVLLYTFGEMAPADIGEEEHLIVIIRKYVEDNYTDSDLNLQTMADNLGYSSKYISRVFKDAMGVTFSSYLTNVRIQNAVFLLDQGVTAIKNVALLTGYKDPFYFSSVFKNIVGMSPSEYIRSGKQSESESK